MSAPVEPWLREILRCPRCRGVLADGVDPDGAPVLICAGPCVQGEAGCRYRIEEGIPVLLPDEAVVQQS
ncbi:hypothetical protein SAMN05421595_0857 [Austwickia chelonae]|uniref:Uncharacterized protein n=1 Tax=Austwickia chelonae NBRC 105200 TaxID=1184607 RepID=K6VSM2_9MICO|nr:hypothetical protein [Austwickia chelonae]GAB78340.1 hypothetical protein AUCHE_08_05870 [Austwickia chelonae NBRC 105200]SEW01631.1 hypothetical protein SAMN05421595_0857 [Austwickia chelonae]